MREYHVYFASADFPEIGPLIKIGFSGDLKQRLSHLSCEFDGLTLLGSAPGDREAERALHRIFRTHRVKGEWFKPTRKIMNLAKYCQRVGRLPLMIESAVAYQSEARDAVLNERLAFSRAARVLSGLGSPILKDCNLVSSVQGISEKYAHMINGLSAKPFQTDDEWQAFEEGKK